MQQTQTGVFAQALSPFMLVGPAPLPDDAPDGFRAMLDHVREFGEKDLDQALGLSTNTGVDLPVTRCTRETFASVMRLAD